MVRHHKFPRKDWISQTDENTHRRRRLYNWHYMSWRELDMKFTSDCVFITSWTSTCKCGVAIRREGSWEKNRYIHARQMWWYVRDSIQVQDVHSDSLSGWDFMAGQRFKWGQLTNWIGFHGGISALQMEQGSTATHYLERISWRHVSNSNGGDSLPR